MALKKYQQMRDFKKTREPAGSLRRSKGPLRFVVQKHDASRLHYDFRLELDGVLKSWAVPKGPSLNPADKRLAMMTEDHPYSYKDFEGIIPKGEYGGGEVIVWDQGVYTSIDTADPEESRKHLKTGLAKGELPFVLMGERLKGGFTLVKLKGREENAWLLVKQKDECASERDVTAEVASVVSGAVLPRDQGEPPSAKRKTLRAPSAPATQKKTKAPPKKRGTDPMPHDVKPMLATLVDEPFDRKGWLFEMKWDGYRAIAEVENGKVRLYSRNGKSFASTYIPIVKALSTLPHDAVLDGEVVALKDGRPDFHTLQRYQEVQAPLQYVAFDLLWADGEDLRCAPLTERKARLKEIMPEHPQLLVSEHVFDKGKQFFRAMRKQHLEGLIAKDGKSAYHEGSRSRSWLKVKVSNEQEAIIVGYTEPRGSRKNLGALVLAAYVDGVLTYIGHSGGGFTARELEDLCKKLSKIKVKEPPVHGKVPINAPITWVAPKYVCQVKFTEWTPSGRMRHPIYAGLRVDKAPQEVTKEVPEATKQMRAGSSRSERSKNHDEPPQKSPRAKNSRAARSSYEPKLTNLHKVFWPEEGYTKGDLIDYYRRMAVTMLPYLKDRPQNLHRHPNGWQGKSFYQKDIKTKVPDFARTEQIWSESNNADLRYLVCDNEETLLYLANLGCIEINPWNSRVGNLDNPDYMIFDLDPDENPMDELVKVACEFRRVLTLACEEHYIKTSGKTGLHICVPLNGRYDYDQIRTFSELVCRLVNRKHPKLTSLERSPKKRKGQIYLDYLQNRFGQTIAAPYSVRPAPHAPVSTPLEWSEVRRGLDPTKFTIKTIHKRLEKKGDLWKPVIGKGVDLAYSIACLEAELT